MVVQRGGHRQPPSFHDPRLRAADPWCDMFDVITNGFGGDRPLITGRK